MIISKQFLSEQLIDGYVRTPPSLKEQALTKLAIHLCQSFHLKKDIICVSDAFGEKISRNTFESYMYIWANLIETRAKAICEGLSFPPKLSSELIRCIRWIAMELFSWNKQHQAIFHTSAELTDQFLTLRDWTIDGRLDETKIAERLVQDETIPACRRYLLACIHSLEPYTLTLWDRATPEQQKDFRVSDNLGNGKNSKLVKLKSYYLAGKLSQLRFIGGENLLWKYQLIEAVKEGARTAFKNFWKTLTENKKQEIIIRTAMYTLSKTIANSSHLLWMMQLLRNSCHTQISRPTHYIDILYFLLSEMSEEQRVSFFRQAIENYKQDYLPYQLDDRVFVCFLEWPYQEFLIPIITKLWDILSEDRYAQQLLMLANRYANQYDESEHQYFYGGLAYGDLLVELLEQTPVHYKRYVFSVPNPDLGSENTCWGAKILLQLIKREPPYKYTDLMVFVRFLRHATLEDKHSIMYSRCGEKLCSHFIYMESMELLEIILIECLTKEQMTHFKKQFLLSDEGKELCFWVLEQQSENVVNLFLNWGCFSNEEISAFKSEVFFRGQGTFSNLLENLGINQLDRLLRRCLSQSAREQYKKELIEKIGIDVCTDFIMGSEWEELTQFLSWCLSEEPIENFKQEFFAKKGIQIHGCLILNQKWKDVQHFFEWCKLSPKAIEQLKKDTCLSSEFLVKICELLYKERYSEVIANCLSWNLVDQETVIACDEAFKRNNHVEFYDFDEEGQQRIQHNWDKLIKKILCEKKKEANNKI